MSPREGLISEANVEPIKRNCFCHDSSGIWEGYCGSRLGCFDEDVDEERRRRARLEERALAVLDRKQHLAVLRALGASLLMMC